MQVTVSEYGNLLNNAIQSDEKTNLLRGMALDVQNGMTRATESLISC